MWCLVQKRGAQTTRTIKATQVQDFNPKSTQDFRKDRWYDVVLEEDKENDSNTESNSTNYSQAKIIRLSVTKEGLENSENDARTRKIPDKLIDEKTPKRDVKKKKKNKKTEEEIQAQKEEAKQILERKKVLSQRQTIKSSDSENEEKSTEPRINRRRCLFRSGADPTVMQTSDFLNKVDFTVMQSSNCKNCLSLETKIVSLEKSLQSRDDEIVGFRKQLDNARNKIREIAVLNVQYQLQLIELKDAKSKHEIEKRADHFVTSSPETPVLKYNYQDDNYSADQNTVHSTDSISKYKPSNAEKSNVDNSMEYSDSIIKHESPTSGELLDNNDSSLEIKTEPKNDVKKQPKKRNRETSESSSETDQTDSTSSNSTSNDESEDEKIDDFITWIERNMSYGSDLHTIQENKFILGNEYYVGKAAWNSMKMKDDNVFIREMMLSLWTRDELLDRCIDTSKAQPLPGHPPRTTMSPQKVKVILKCYLETRLNRRMLTNEKKEQKLKQAHSLMGSKISEFIKQEKARLKKKDKKKKKKKASEKQQARKEKSKKKKARRM